MKVSIVIPCFNAAQHIDESLASALGQDHEDVEIICVDNGSTDQTLDYLRSYAEKGEIRLLDQPKKGAPAARNLGLEQSNGEWVQFLDADDIILPAKISHQVRLIKEYGVASFVASVARKTDLKSGISQSWPVNENAWSGLMQNQLGITSANLFSRQALEDAEGWDEDLKSSQEYDLMFRIMQRGGKVIIDNERELSVIQSRSDGSISSTDISGNKQRLLHLLSRISVYLKTERPSEYAALGKDFFQDVYKRILFDSIEGGSDSVYFYKNILPDGFEPEDDKNFPAWFKHCANRFGFASAHKLMRLKNMISSHS